MAIIMLAIGSLLSVIGLYAIVSGYPMIEIERGWASVIAGSVLLSGGLVVASLGLVLRALTRMRAPLPVGAQIVPAPAAAMVEPGLAPFAPPPLDAPPLAANVPAVVAPAAAAAAALAAGHGTRPEAPAFAAPSEPEAPSMPAAALESHPPPPAAESPADAWDERTFSAFDYEAETEAQTRLAEMPHAEHAEPAAPPPTHDHAARADADLPEASAARAPKTESGADDHPADYDLSHPKFSSYADEEEDPEPTTESHPAGYDQIQHEHAEHAQAEALHAEPAVEPAAEAPATAPESPPANLTVIGRYDSEGTSYIMYSDGSIEAQSEAGIYRFGSMAELKAFIEG